MDREEEGVGVGRQLVLLLVHRYINDYHSVIPISSLVSDNLLFSPCWVRRTYVESLYTDLLPPISD